MIEGFDWRGVIENADEWLKRQLSYRAEPQFEKSTNDNLSIYTEHLKSAAEDPQRVWKPNRIEPQHYQFILECDFKDFGLQFQFITNSFLVQAFVAPRMKRGKMMVQVSTSNLSSYNETISFYRELFEKMYLEAKE